MHAGVIGGRLGYYLLRRINGSAVEKEYCHGDAYAQKGKLETLFGPQIWAEISGKVVIDFGCGIGGEVIEMARHGAKKAIGIDIRQNVLDIAKMAAEKEGVSGRCVFSTHTDEKADIIFSIDGFEHYDDPEQILQVMRQLINPGGRVFISFGPPWFHPLGGHLFSVFPWAHLLFSEKALIRWRSDFKSDGATRFCEVEGGLNQMTVRRFKKLLDKSEFESESFEPVPIKKLRWVANPLTREFTTSVVRCGLIPKRDGR